MRRRDILKAGGALTALAVGHGAVAHPLLHAEPLRRAPIGIRRSKERGYRDMGWLKARHTFSFGSYRDRRWDGFRSLRVINEDHIQAGRGFPMHGHRDMEILTYVLGGAIEHKDSLGNGGVIVPGEIQKMSAGSGIRHSEFNPSKKQGLHLLQIWMQPERRNLRPGYQEKRFPKKKQENKLQLVGSRKGRDGSVRIHQDLDLFACNLAAGKHTRFALRSKRYLWLQLARGSVRVNGHVLTQGDAAYAMKPGTVDVTAVKDAEFLLFDLA